MVSFIEIKEKSQKFYLKDTRTGEENYRTAIIFYRDKENMYFRFECREEFFYPKHFNYNDPLYEGDIAELMISLGDKNTYLETETNFNGADYCVLIENKDGRGDISITKLTKKLFKSHVQTLEDGWACDIIVNMDELKKIGFADRFYFNVHRQDFDENGNLHLYSLSPTYCDTFHVTERFIEGRIK